MLPVERVVDEYAACCADWGRRTFSSVPAAGRLADLLTAAAGSSGLMGVPLFAGWRARLLSDSAPTDDPARLALALQVMREHRGGLHLVAVAAAGIDPLQAVMSGRYGAGNAEFFRWPQPWPDPELARDAMAEAERVTDVLVRRRTRRCRRRTAPSWSRGCGRCLVRACRCRSAVRRCTG